MIRFEHVDKVYRLGQFNSGTLWRDLQSWWAVRHNREDPNTKIGQGNRQEEGQFYALKDIDLTIYQGERLGIIGGNGAGKSTMLKLISRVTAPSGGEIDLYGRVTSMLEVGTGFNGEMTGLENIYMNGAILGMNRGEIDAVLEDIIDFSEVRQFIDTPVKRYSSGMYVKLAFSVAAHLKSEIMIMDEVLAVGDMAFQKKCIAKMREAALDQNRTILYVSHNMNTIRELCDRCLVLDRGRIVFDGEVNKAIQYYGDYLMRAEKNGSSVAEEVRRRSGLTGLCRISSVYVLNRSLKSGDVLEFTVNLESKIRTEGLIVRMVLSSAEGTLIGMGYSGRAALSEGHNTLACRFTAESLAPGGYVCDIAVCEFDGATESCHDFVSKVMSFYVEEDEKFFGRAWKTYAWGTVKLPAIEIKEEVPI